MKKYFKKIISVFAIIILLFGLISVYKNLAGEIKVEAANVNYVFKTDGSYKWVLEGGNLVNYVDVYDKTTNAKITTLKIFYSDPKEGNLYAYGTTNLDPLGALTMYTLASTSDSSKFLIPIEYKGKYKLLAQRDSSKTYGVYYIPSGDGNYIFKIDDAEKSNLNESKPENNDWFGVYLNSTMTTIKSGGSNSAFAGSTATGELKTPSSGSTTTTDSTGIDKCGRQQIQCEKTPDPPTLPANEDIPTISESLKMGNISTAWALSLDLVNVLAIFVLLAIAFANILHIGEREMFSFKRMIPAFVIGLILANFSHLICRAIIDFAGMLMNFFVPKEHAFDTMFNIMIGMFSGWFGNTGAMEWGIAGAGAIGVAVVGILAGGGCGLILIGLIILFFPAIIMFVLMFLLAARTYILWFLVILSPIAFFGMFFDPLKRTIGTWWNWFLMWTFMGPIAYFFIYLAEGFARNTEGTANVICFNPLEGNQVGGFTKYLIVNVLLILSVYVPYALGSKIGMGLWAGIGKFLGKQGLTMGGKGLQKSSQLTGNLLAKTAFGKGMGKRLVKSLQDRPNYALLPEAIFGREGLFGNIKKADIAATSKQAQKTVERLPGGRDLTRNMNREFGIQNGDKFAQGSGWEVGSLSADQDRIVNAHLNAAPIKLGTNASREDANILAFRMQRLRQLTGLTGTPGAKNHLAFSDIYGPAKDLQDVESTVHQKSGGRVKAKLFKKYRKQVDEEVSAARETRTAGGSARTFLAQDIMDGTALSLDADLREGQLAYMASRRTTEKPHGTPGPMNP